MNNENPTKYESQDDDGQESFEKYEGSADESREEGSQSEGDFAQQANSRYQPRTRYPRRRLTGNARRRKSDKQGSKDRPLRQRMKIYRNRRSTK